MTALSSGPPTSKVTARQRQSLVHVPGQSPLALSWVDWTSTSPDMSLAAVLVHGALAHARWWDHLAPRILDLGFSRVAAVDLSGHGRSGWRPVYTRALWAAELAAFIQQLDAVDAVVLGHSLGGAVALQASQLAPHAWSQTVIVDSVIHWEHGRRPGGVNNPFARIAPDGARAERQNDAGSRDDGRRRHYSTRDDAAARLRLLPPQEVADDGLFRHIARESVRLEPGRGWTWRFDPRVLDKRSDEGDPLTWGDEPARAQLAYIRGEHSTLVPPQRFDQIVSLLGVDRTATVPDAQHHVILDQPEGFMTALRDVLSVPR